MSMRCCPPSSRPSSSFVSMSTAAAFALFLVFFLLLLLPAILSPLLAAESPQSLMNKQQSNRHRNGTSRERERMLPKQIPKLGRAEKRQLILEQFMQEGRSPPRHLLAGGPKWMGGPSRRRQKKRRGLGAERPWRRYMVRRQYRPRLNRLLTAQNTLPCPETVDSVTEAFNKRLYLFAGEMVYEVWRDRHGLQQRQAFPVTDLFPDGPRRVTVALTNRKSGVTLLLSHRSIYRYRWNRAHKRFYLARNSPRELPAKVDFLPRIGFQWKDGHLILANKENFVSYDPYWNVAAFVSNKTADYFPNLPIDRLAGVVKYGRESMLWLSREGRVQLYELDKGRLGLELPLNLPKLLACLPGAASSTITTTSASRRRPPTAG